MLGYLDLREDLLESENLKNQHITNNKCPEIPIRLNNIEVVALIDSGSQINGISEEWYLRNKERLGKVETLKLSNTNVKGAIGTKSKLIRKQILLDVEIENYQFELVFFIIPALNKDCILGISMLREGECIIDFKLNTLNINNPQYKGNNCHESFVQLNQLAVEVNRDDNNFHERVAEITTISNEHKQKLLQIFEHHKNVFREEPGRIRGYEHELLVYDNTPFFQKGWPIPIAYQERVEEEIRKMVRFGVIERANGQYINPLVTIIKKDQSVRLCLDARKLNKVLIPDFEGAQPIHELLSNCGRVKYMSTIDLRSSFWQIPIKKECRDYTGFMYKGKTYRFTVTPFGLKTSLASLTRGLDMVLSEEVKKSTIIYVDDCLCLSNSVEEHLVHLRLLLRDLNKANITVNFKKSQFFRERN